MPLFHVTVREHTYTGRFYHEVVEAESFEDALQLAAGRATAPQPPPGSEPEPDGVNHRRCADVWLDSLLRCELAEGHDEPHMGTARGYRRPAMGEGRPRPGACVARASRPTARPGFRRAASVRRASGTCRPPFLIARTWPSPQPQRVH